MSPAWRSLVGSSVTVRVAALYESWDGTGVLPCLSMTVELFTVDWSTSPEKVAVTFDEGATPVAPPAGDTDATVNAGGALPGEVFRRTVTVFESHSAVDRSSLPSPFRSAR